MGKMLLVTGLAIALTGLLVMMSQKPGSSGWFGWFGNLPLDIRIEKENLHFYFPLGSSILLSLVLSLILYIINTITR